MCQVIFQISVLKHLLLYFHVLLKQCLCCSVNVSQMVALFFFLTT